MKTKILKLLLPFIAVIILLAGCRAQQAGSPAVVAGTIAETVAETVAETLEESVAGTVAKTAEESVAETEKLTEASIAVQETETQSDVVEVTEDGQYTSKDEVAAYIHQFGKLPSNYISKSKARKLGWDSSEGNLGEALPGMSIGGGVFKNHEGMLPEAPGREYRECDIDYDGGKRGAKRIVYSNDGLIFYTGDHYETFEQLY